MGVGPATAVGGKLAIHQARVDGRQPLVANAQLFRHIGAVVHQNDVDLLDQAGQDLLCLRLGQIEGQAALAPVVGHEGAAFGLWMIRGREALREAPRLAPGRLDLDDVGAHFGQDPPGQRPGDDLGKVGHPHAFKGTRHCRYLRGD